MRIAVVGHCWKYARCLNYHLSGFYLHPPRPPTELDIVICYCMKDDFTVDVLDYFCELDWPENVRLLPFALPQSRILNRAIGRNAVLARHGTPGYGADRYWMIDIDYILRDGCLDALAAMELPLGRLLFYPESTQFSLDHSMGDTYSQRVTHPMVLDINPNDFIEHRPSKGIGGIQIVTGETARKYGYCPDHAKSHRPVEGDKFRRNFSDLAFRKSLGDGGGCPISLPGVYRIRQTDFGCVDNLED